MFDLNQILVISLAVLAFFSFCFLVLLIPVVFQLIRTLNSAQLFLDSVNDFKPTIDELKGNINKVRGFVDRGSKSIKEKIYETRVCIASSAYGLLAGFREYLASYKSMKNSYNSNGKYETKIKGQLYKDQG